MSDETDKEQREALKKAGKKIKEAKKNVNDLDKDHFTNPPDAGEGPEGRDRQAREAFKKKLRKKLNKLKQLLNDGKYEDADNLIDDFIDEFRKGYQANGKDHTADPTKQLIKDIEKLLNELEETKDEELWSAGDSLLAAFIAAALATGPVLEPSHPKMEPAPKRKVENRTKRGKS